MRALIVLLLGTCLAGSAFALTPLSPETAPAAGAAGAALAIPTTINGKFVVGYEGRGDYLKNAQLAKHSGDSPSKAPVAGLPEEMALDASGKAGVQSAASAPQSAPAKPSAAAASAPAAAKPAMRNDSALSNDSTKLKPIAAATTAATVKATTPAVQPQTQPTAPSGMNNPMVLVGGRIQR